MKIHDCKILPEHFENVLAGLKPFKIMAVDRDPPYAFGDELMLREWTVGGYTGRGIIVDVLIVLRGEYCKPGYCVMGIAPKAVGARGMTKTLYRGYRT